MNIGITASPMNSNLSRLNNRKRKINEICQSTIRWDDCFSIKRLCETQ